MVLVVVANKCVDVVDAVLSYLYREYLTVVAIPTIVVDGNVFVVYFVTGA